MVQAQPHRRRAACVRDDLEALVAGARGLDLYTNLITSGIPLHARAPSEARGPRASTTCRCRCRTSGAGIGPHRRPAVLRAQARGVRAGQGAGHAAHAQRGAPPREPRTGSPEIVALAESPPGRSPRAGQHRSTSAGRWSTGARSCRRASSSTARASVARAARQRLLGTHGSAVRHARTTTPSSRRACMDGWGRRFIVISPDGLALPCHAAHTLPGLDLRSASATASLDEIWHHSAAFNAFRGEAWMPEPCRSCDKRTVDFGGCRCQAYHLTGSAAATDPACSLAPDHGADRGGAREALTPSRARARYRSARSSAPA